MCGFCGFTGQVAGREEVIREMADRITHRGPDSEGYYLDGSIAMAFRRLSIIDLGGGSQPIYNEDRSKVLMFNGEIYNYRSLREELLAAGHVFTTETDSEVLLHGFEEWKEDLLPRLARAGLPLYATALGEDTQDIRTLPLGRAAVVIGSEGRGVSPAVLVASEKTLQIPMTERCESLNAAAAGTVVLWQMGFGPVG